MLETTLNGPHRCEERREDLVVLFRRAADARTPEA